MLSLYHFIRIFIVAKKSNARNKNARKYNKANKDIRKGNNMELNAPINCLIVYNKMFTLVLMAE